MRKSKVETAKTRERIIKAAGAKFAANGISEAALARVMAAAGLTHGGFYRHFASKDPLVLEACSETVFSLVARPGIAHQRKASRAGAWAHCASICVAPPSQPAENRLSPGRSGERTGAERHQDSSRGHRRISPPVPADCQPTGDGSVPQASGNVDGDRLRHSGRDHTSPHCPRFANLTFCSGCNARLHHPVRAAAATMT
jgi:Bacterial regulatory proteins, tetR family